MDTNKAANMVALPGKVIARADGGDESSAVEVDLDKVLDAIMTWEKPKMAKWIIDGLPKLEDFIEAVKGAVITKMLKEGRDVIPTGDGRELVLNKGGKPTVNQNVLEQAKEAFIEDGYDDEDVQNLVREGTKPVTNLATIPAIQKLAKRGGPGAALALMAIERPEGKPKLDFKGKKKLTKEEQEKLIPQGDFGGET